MAAKNGMERDLNKAMVERPVSALIEDLEGLKAFPVAEEAQRALRAFQRLLNPVFMMLSQAALADDPIADDHWLFTFSGSGSSDMTSVGDFRKLMGDEREILKKWMKEKEDAEHEEAMKYPDGQCDCGKAILPTGECEDKCFTRSKQNES